MKYKAGDRVRIIGKTNGRISFNDMIRNNDSPNVNDTTISLILDTNIFIGNYNFYELDLEPYSNINMFYQRLLTKVTKI